MSYKMEPLVRLANKVMPFTSRWMGRAYIDASERPMLRSISKILGDNLVIAEVGVYEGEHAKAMLEKLSIKTLYLVDPYRPYSESIEKGIGLDKAKKIAKARISSPNVVWIEKTSKEACKEVPNDLDAVYIDAAHDFTNVLTDCKVWYPKIRKGGILGGHDYNNLHKEVRSAVDQFCEKLPLKTKNNDWWVIKQ